MSPVVNTAREVLKSKTDELHLKLHRLAVFEQLLDGSLEVHDYLRMMNCFHAFYLELDTAMHCACETNQETLCGYVYQPRAPLFAADIVALGSGFRDRAKSPTFFSLPEIESTENIAGVAYVIDGSVLGGMTMNKAVASLLSDDNLVGRTYWNWCRLHGAAQWKSALALVEACWHADMNRSAISNSAVETFAALNVALGSEGDFR